MMLSLAIQPITDDMNIPAVNTTPPSTNQNIDVSPPPSQPSYNYKTIGEVSSELGVPPYVLRFWESKFFIIKPHKRKGGHRYYSHSDVELIKQIKKLLYEEGFTIKGAKKYLKENKPMYFAKNQPNLFGNVQADSITLENKASPVTYLHALPTNKNTIVEKIPEKAEEPNNNSVNKTDPVVIHSLIKQLESVKDLLNSDLS